MDAGTPAGALNLRRLIGSEKLEQAGDSSDRDNDGDKKQFEWAHFDSLAVGKGRTLTANLKIPKRTFRRTARIGKYSRIPPRA